LLCHKSTDLLLMAVACFEVEQSETLTGAEENSSRKRGFLTFFRLGSREKMGGVAV
jgi:hypothetical protein